jgi:colanic acid/amylovoran biosynthesis glycosyltransferase
MKPSNECTIMDDKTIVYVLEKFPSPTEYFVLNEILELEKKGIALRILVLNKQKKYLTIPELRDLKSTIHYLPKVYYYFSFLLLFLSPISIIRFQISPQRPINFLKRLRKYYISLFFVQKLKDCRVAHIHAHFAFIASDIAQIVSHLTGVNFSVTAHAQDIYMNEDKINTILPNVLFLITCTRYNYNYINSISENKFADKIFHIYHGISISKWDSNELKHEQNNGIAILSIARLVEKKGLLYLLKAIHLLIEQKMNIRCTIIGEGPLQGQLEYFIMTNSLGEHVKIVPFLPQNEIKTHYLNSNIFVLPCIVAKNGDMDGLPNVIIEAMALGIPVISTPISAIKETIEHRETGLLIPEKSESAIANAIMELINDRYLYHDIARKGKIKIQEEFAIDTCTNKIIELFKNKVLNINGNIYK